MKTDCKNVPSVSAETQQITREGTRQVNVCSFAEADKA